MLVDPLGRRLTHLRLSVTRACDLACVYCHREGCATTGPDMSLDRIREIVRALGTAGLSKVKITGGEPLVRPDIVDIVATLRDVGLFPDISMTTNGVRLASLARPLAAAGLGRVNIGCDSLSSSVTPKTMARAQPGLEAAVEAGLGPIKLNMVVMRDVNEHEIDELIAFGRARGAILQLIELIPTGPDDPFFARHHVSLKPLRDALAARATAIRTRDLQGREQFDVDGATVEIVSPFHRSFCGSCTKLRVTSDGRLLPCLMRDDLAIPWAGPETIAEAVARRMLPDAALACEG